MRKIHFVLFLLLSLGCSAQNVTVKSNDARIHYMGRTNEADGGTLLYWSGTSIHINFNGTGVKAVLKDERGDNYYQVIVDGEVKPKFEVEEGKKEYTLVSGLSKGTHTLELFKCTEWAMGKSWFYGFNLDEGTSLLQAPATKKRKIEFYGNSITCGFAVEDTTGKDRGTAPYENNYKSYAAITARHFNTEYSCIAKSGIGVVVSWFPLIMPEMYDRVDPEDEKSKWDFSKYTPDLVVVNLFQNDSWITKLPDHEQFKARFGNQAPTPEFIINAYRDFIKTIRNKYPKTQIICALGSMDATREGSPWPGYIEKAVSGLKDQKIYTHFFAYKNTGGHPSEKEQKDMAASLISFIDQRIKW